MKKCYLFAALLCIACSTVRAQNFNYQWANTIGTSTSNTTNDETVLFTSALDASDNLYVAGYYYNTVDYDPGATTTLLTSISTGLPDMFYAKYSSSGALVWAKGIGGSSSDYIQSMALDGTGNLYLGGYFNSATIDADPGASVATLTSAGGYDAFFGKYDNSGNYVWAKNIGGTSDDYIQSIAVDATGNVYVGGYYSGTMDADPGATVNNLVSAGSVDAFYAKYDNTGNYVWAKSLGGTSADYIKSIAVDATGNVYVGGYFNSATMDADPGAAVNNLTSAGGYDAFFGKYDNTGAYVMAKNIGGTSDDYLQAIAIDGTGNIYTSGYFSGTMDADPGASVNNLTSVGGIDAFFGKYTNTGGYTWAKNIGGTSTDQALAMTVDGSGNVYVAGSFSSSTMDADPGTATTNLTNSGTSSLFWGKYDNGGNYSFAMAAGGTATALARAIKYSNTTFSAYIAGSHTSTPIDMDPGTSTNNISMVGNPTYATNGLFARYVCVGAVPTVSIGASATTICAATLVTFTATPVNGGTSPSYQWKKNGVNVGTNSATYTDNTLVNNDVITCIMTSSNGCLAVPTATSNAITMTLVTSLTATISISTPATTICSGTNATFTAVITNGGAGPVYQWKKNGTNVGTSASTYSDNALINGDVITCVLTSNAACVSSPNVTSNAVTMTVNPTTTPSVVISTPSQGICGGTPTTFTAVPTNGGTTPAYQWKLNGTNVGTNSNTYSNSTLANNDIVTCVMTSNATCTSPATGTSNAITMSVSTPPPTTITFAGLTTFCSDDSLILNAPAGTGYTYKWKLNTFDIFGATAPTYVAKTAGAYTVQVTNAINCSATSTALTLTVNASPLVVITYSSPLSFCSGQAVVLNTYTTNPGYTYQWKNNSIDIPGATNKNYVATTLGNYSVNVTSAQSCQKLSAAVGVTVYPLPTPVVVKTGSILSTGVFNTYQWYYNFQPISGANGQTLNIGSGSDGPYNVATTDNNGCMGLSPVYYVNALGVGQVGTGTEILVYPNPAYEKVFVKSPAPVKLTVMDMHGKTLVKDVLTNEVDVSQWADGVYFISIFDKEMNLLKTQQLVKSAR